MVNDTGFILFTVFVGLVACERVLELIVARRNLRWSLRHGGVQIAGAHDGAILAVHVFLLAGSVAEVWIWKKPMIPAVSVAMVVIVLFAQGLRWWCITTLGHRWNTRVVIVPSLPPVTTGPYRWLSHPNYVAVVIEGVALPMAGLAWGTAIVFTLMNSPLLASRIRVEDAALATLPRR